MIKAGWKKLILANYIVDAEVLTAYLPFGTEPDRLNGDCFVSLVGFMFMDTRIMGLKFPFHVNFEEVNLRFYVRHYHNGEWKRGVVFIKEIVPLPGITLVANTVYRENYVTHRMKHRWEFSADELDITYQWKKERWHSLRILSESHPLLIKPASKEMFFTDQHWGYTRIDKGTTYVYEVAHPDWVYYETKKFEIDVNFETLYGTDFAFLNQQKPHSVFLAEGSDISLKKSTIIH